MDLLLHMEAISALTELQQTETFIYDLLLTSTRMEAKPHQPMEAVLFIGLGEVANLTSVPEP